MLMASNKIGFKLGLVILAAFTVVLAALFWSIDRMFSGFYNSEMTTEVEELTAHFAAMTTQDFNGGQTGAQTGTPAGAQTGGQTGGQTAMEFADFSGVSIFYVDRNGNLLAKSGEPVAGFSFIRKQDQQTLFAGQPVSFKYQGADGGHYLVSARKVPASGSGSAETAVYVLSSTKHMDESLIAVRRLLVLAGIGAFLLAAGITWIISRMLSSPLLQMQRATRKLAAGELDTRLDIASRDEIGLLAGAINELAVELKRYRDNRQEFFANISHELRTPITYLEGYAQVLRSGMYKTEDERRQYLDIIHQEAKRLQRMVSDLFELAQMEEGKISLSLEWLDLSELAENAVRKVRLKAESKGLQLGLSIDEDLPLIYADGLRTEQVLSNLLENAVRYTDQGEISMTVLRNKQGVLLAVEDTGIGIPEDELPLIFDRFYRVEKSRSRQHGGTGLGLPIARKLMELQEGELNAYSRPGSGTRFEVLFTRIFENGGLP